MLDTVTLGRFVLYIVTMGQTYVAYSVTGTFVVENMTLGQIYFGLCNCDRIILSTA
jgi:hypothetical protein